MVLNLVAVVIGYILGIIPFVVLNILIINGKKESEKEETDKEKVEEKLYNYYKNQEDILNEWLNGSINKEDDNEINQEDIFKEYVTGKTVKKGV